MNLKPTAPLSLILNTRCLKDWSAFGHSSMIKKSHPELNREMAQWFLDKGIPYKLDIEKIKIEDKDPNATWYSLFHIIIFENPNDLLEFKLTWI